MIYRRSERFRKAFKNLPKETQEKVYKAFVILREDPGHPSLMIKKMQGLESIWEGRIDHKYRFTFHNEIEEITGESVCVFRNIDNHDACLRNP